MYELKSVLLSSAALLGAAYAHSAAVYAADLNGYTAEYECRAGGPRCNVDVAGLAAQACQQIIEPGTPWSAIDWTNNVVCLRAGDHIGKGSLTITASGTPNARKILRCVTGDGAQCPDPWTTSTRAALRQLVLNGADFFIVDRIAIPASTAFVNDGDRLVLKHDADSNIISRVLVEGRPSPGVPYYGAISAWEGSPSDNTTVQNSVARTNYGQTGMNCVGIGFTGGSNNVIVNNELYDWCEHTIQHGHNGGGNMPGTVVENNDIYNTPAFDGYSEALNTSKAYGSQENPMKWIHNRMWHNRWGTNTSEGGGGTLLSLADSQVDLPSWATSWTLIQNNIFMDAYDGVGGYRYLKHHISTIGNIFYGIRDYDGRVGTEADAVQVDIASNAEMYFNTVVASDYWALFGYDGSNNDVRANVAIDADVVGSPRPGDTVDHNAYYNATNSIDGTKIDRAVTVRSDGAAYSAGTVMRRTADTALCTSGDDPDCFLYKATHAGTTGTSPAFCVTLGCTFTDGGVTWQAVRGPHVFWRQLKTAPQQTVIPYAVPHTSADERDLSPPTLGSLPDRGINNDTLGSGILAKDMKGASRGRTPGAIQATAGSGSGNGGSVTYVSDLPYVAVANGWGPVEKDMSNGEQAAGDGRTLTLNGVTYAKGLGAHAVSEVRVPLNGNYTRFISDIGIDDEMDGTAGTAQFEVWADGVRLYQSPDMNAASPTLTVNVDVTGKQELRLLVLEGSVGCCDHADWAGARLVSNITYISDLPYVAVTNGFGPVEKDTSNGESAAGDGRTITLNGVTYAKGLGVHAVSEVRVPLGGNYTRFISDIGIDDEMDGTAGTAQFEIWADGVMLYQSPDMNAASHTLTVNVDVAGRQELVLKVLEGSVGCCDHADWAGARLLANSTFVSDLPYVAVANGFGPVEKDTSNGESAAGDGRTITLNGVTYAKGLGVHAVSEVRVPLGGNYTRFISDIGIDDEMDGTAGTAQFEVWADGVRLYQSPDMNAASPTIAVNVDVTGRQELVLKVLEGSVGCCDHADWAGAQLQL